MIQCSTEVSFFVQATFVEQIESIQLSDNVW